MSLFIAARSILMGSGAIAGLGYVKARTEHLIVRQQPRGVRERSWGWARRGQVAWRNWLLGGTGRKMGGFFLHVLGGKIHFSVPRPPPASLKHQASGYGLWCLPIAPRVFSWFFPTGRGSGNSPPSSSSPQEVKT